MQPGPNSRIKLVCSSLAALVGAMLCSAPALADVVGPPPDSCPAGSTPESCHGGPYCAPAAPCVDDTSCAEGKTCLDTKLCRRQINCGGRTTYYVDEIVGPCKSDGTCGEGSCKTYKVCRDPESNTTSRGCSCRLGAQPDGLLAMLAGVLLLAWTFWRRRG